MLPKTEDELKEEWGLERFVGALVVLSDWYLDKRHPISEEQMIILKEQSEDAFRLFASHLFYQTESLIS